MAIILAGGDGTRLWPVSTESTPKQLSARLFRVPLIKQAYDRTASILSTENTYILTTHKLAADVAAATGIPSSHLLVEPMKRDTGAAFAFAAGYFAAYEDVACAILYADHVIPDMDEFSLALERAFTLAERSRILVTIGTIPSEPKTELGYVLRGEPAPADRSYAVSAFIEKPKEEVARELLAQGALWNTGMYVWRPEVLLEIMEETAPELVAGAREAGDAYHAGRTERVTDWYQQAPCGAFDRFVSERTTRFGVVESAHTWKDVGTWQTFYEVLPKDEHGNVCILPSDGSVTVYGSQGNMIAPTHKHVVLIGVSDLVIASNDENLLIAHRDQSHKVKEVLKQRTTA